MLQGRLLSVNLLLLSGQSEDPSHTSVEESDKSCTGDVDLLVETAVEFADTRVQIFGVFVKGGVGGVQGLGETSNVLGDAVDVAFQSSELGGQSAVDSLHLC